MSSDTETKKLPWWYSEEYGLPDFSDLIEQNRSEPPSYRFDEVRQRIFYKVARHLMLQVDKSTDPNLGGCAYRGTTSGDKKPDRPVACAVGCLIPDDVYSASIIEGALVDTVLALPDGPFPRWLESVCGDLLKDLQKAHDDTKTMLELYYRLLQVHDRFSIAEDYIPAEMASFPVSAFDNSPKRKDSCKYV